MHKMKFEYANVKYGSFISKNKKVIAVSKCYLFLDTLYKQTLTLIYDCHSDLAIFVFIQFSVISVLLFL